MSERRTDRDADQTLDAWMSAVAPPRAPARLLEGIVRRDDAEPPRSGRTAGTGSSGGRLAWPASRSFRPVSSRSCCARTAPAGGGGRDVRRRFAATTVPPSLERDAVGQPVRRAGSLGIATDVPTPIPITPEGRGSGRRAHRDGRGRPRISGSSPPAGLTGSTRWPTRSRARSRWGRPRTCTTVRGGRTRTRPVGHGLGRVGRRSRSTSTRRRPRRSRSRRRRRGSWRQMPACGSHSPHEGTVVRIDPATNKVVATVTVGLSGPSGPNWLASGLGTHLGRRAEQCDGRPDQPRDRRRPGHDPHAVPGRRVRWHRRRDERAVWDHELHRPATR